MTDGIHVERPQSLTGRAAEIWDEHAPSLVKEGMLTSRDALVFAVWCSLGAKIESGSLTPASVAQFRLLANDFGLSPSGKGREAKPAAPKPKSKFFGD